MQKKKILVFFLILWISLTVAAFFPSVILNPSLYSKVRLAVYGLLSLLFVSTSAYRAIPRPFFRVNFCLLFLTFIMLLVFFAVGFRFSWADIINILVVLVAMCIGYAWKIDANTVENLTLVFGALSVLLGVFTMFFFVGSIKLSQFMYLVDTKNMVGQIVAAGTIGLTLITFTCKTKRWIKYPLLVLSVILTFFLRCRTAAAAYVLFVAYFIWKRYDYRQMLFFVIAVGALLAVFHSSVSTFFSDVFVGKLDVTDTDSLSAGRMHRNVDGWNFFTMHPLFGEMNTPSDLQNIHNYVLRRLAAYGVFSFPFQLIYIVFFINLIKQWLKVNMNDVRCVGLMMMIVPFFSSFLEPLSPFGPGLVQIIIFFFYGMYLRSEMISSTRS